MLGMVDLMDDGGEDVVRVTKLMASVLERRLMMAWFIGSLVLILSVLLQSVKHYACVSKIVVIADNHRLQTRVSIYFTSLIYFVDCLISTSGRLVLVLGLDGWAHLGAKVEYCIGRMFQHWRSSHSSSLLFKVPGAARSG